MYVNLCVHLIFSYKLIYVFCFFFFLFFLILTNIQLQINHCPIKSLKQKRKETIEKSRKDKEECCCCIYSMCVGSVYWGRVSLDGCSWTTHLARHASVQHSQWLVVWCGGENVKLWEQELECIVSIHLSTWMTEHPEAHAHDPGNVCEGIREYPTPMEKSSQSTAAEVFFFFPQHSSPGPAGLSPQGLSKVLKLFSTELGTPIISSNFFPFHFSFFPSSLIPHFIESPDVEVSLALLSLFFFLALGKLLALIYSSCLLFTLLNKILSVLTILILVLALKPQNTELPASSFERILFLAPFTSIDSWVKDVTLTVIYSKVEGFEISLLILQGHPKNPILLIFCGGSMTWEFLKTVFAFFFVKFEYWGKKIKNRVHCKKKLAQLPGVDMQHAPAKHVCTFKCFGMVTVQSFLGVSACQLQAVEKVFFAVVGFPKTVGNHLKFIFLYERKIPPLSTSSCSLIYGVHLILIFLTQNFSFKFLGGFYGGRGCNNIIFSASKSSVNLMNIKKKKLKTKKKKTKEVKYHKRVCVDQGERFLRKTLSDMCDEQYLSGEFSRLNVINSAK
ncbi:hypothetical protein VP01_233g3 [Puccinia sorghi]|uniref:Uncharacterized protein n=1 Tax=Puccinia sorghi TaxID=27349 RepID=A0A0L6V7J7_9BASI|nr:hypothetical protein VP01_233g3 [Puccinia sorghi]